MGRGWLKNTLFVNQARHNSNAYNRPWLALALALKEEVCMKAESSDRYGLLMLLLTQQTCAQIRKIEETAEQLKALKSLRGIG